MIAAKPLFHSYTFRLALLYALLFSASTLLLFFFFYWFTAKYMSEQMDTTIEAEIQGLAERYDQSGLSGLRELIEERVNRQSPTSNSVYLLVNYNLQPIIGNLDRWPKGAEIQGDWVEFLLEVAENDSETHAARAKIFRLPENYGLLVGRDIFQLTEAKARIIQALGWGMAIMVLLAFMGGLLLSRRTVRKMERINVTARSIISGDLSRRIPLTPRGDDFDQMADNLNNMLDRIQQLMLGIRRVSDNIAHDLRTPLTRLRQNLERALENPKADADTQELLDSSINEADNLLGTFNALLRIARIEAGQGMMTFNTMPLDALLDDIIELYEPLAEDKQQRLIRHIDKNISVDADRDLLFQCLANILENAIKYTPEQGQIAVSLSCDESYASITIADNGPGIPSEDREKVFQRFYRVDQSRTTVGNGLGLSMVLAIINQHNAAIELDDNNPGLITRIKIPFKQP